ncbi:MAG: ABC transporter permease, partial [Nitrospinota bacterium]
MIDPTVFDLLTVGVLFGIVLLLSVREHLGLERTFLYAAFRTVVQLL